MVHLGFPRPSGSRTNRISWPWAEWAEVTAGTIGAVDSRRAGPACRRAFDRHTFTVVAVRARLTIVLAHVVIVLADGGCF